MSNTFFGIQVVARNFISDSAAAPASRDHRPVGQRAVARGEARLLEEGRRGPQRGGPAFEMGYWDLIRGDGAEEEFESWSSEIEGSLATEKEELGAAADEVSRISAEKRYVVVTLVFLVEGRQQQRPDPRRALRRPQVGVLDAPDLRTANRHRAFAQLRQRRGRRRVPGARNRRGRLLDGRPPRRRLRVPQAPPVRVALEKLE